MLRLSSLRLSALASFLIGVAVFAVGIVMACSSGDSGQPADEFNGFDVRATDTPTAAATSTPTPTATATPTATPTPYDGMVARMKIPRFNVDAAVEAIGLLPSNEMDVPKNPHNVGWYYIWDKPGWGGNAVFSAHVDYYPNIRGPFYNLKDLNPGDEIIVVMDGGPEYVYRVISKQRYRVDEIPTGDLIEAPTKPPDKEWITLITCGGEFVPIRPGGPGEYLHRDVVIAERVQ